MRNYLFIFLLSFFILNICYAQDDTIRMQVGQQRIYQLRGDAVRVDSGDPKVMGIDKRDARSIILTARGEGYTTLTVKYADGSEDVKRIIVEKGIPPEELAKEVKQILGDIEGITVRLAGGKVVIEGEIYTYTDLAKYDKVISMYGNQVVSLVIDNVRKYMVQIDVKVLEVSTSDVKNLGINWFYANNMEWNVDFPTIQYKGWNSADGAIDFGEEELAHVIPYPPRVVMPIFRFPMTVRIDALEQSGKVKMLAKPQLITKSGKSANFHVGGEVPVVAVGLGTSQIEWKKYGVSITIEPVVLGNSMIDLKIRGEVSQLDWANAVSDIPALRNRTVESEVNLKSGETIAIAGLLQNNKEKNKRGLPVLNKIPVIGSLIFGSTHDEFKETETIILVTPTIIQKTGTIDKDVTPCNDKDNEHPCE